MWTREAAFRKATMRGDYSAATRVPMITFVSNAR